MSADREMLEILQRRHAPPLGDPLAAGRQGAAEAAAEVSSWLDLAKLIGPITWDWPKWLAPGFLHLLAARTGLGKSTLALRIAACYLAGWTWPDGNAFEGAHAAVLWIESEGAQALNLERAGKWGLPLGRILSPWPDPLADANILNARHRRAIEAAAHVPEVRLIVLDSLSGARASADENDSRALQSMKWLNASCLMLREAPASWRRTRRRSRDYAGLSGRFRPVSRCPTHATCECCGSSAPCKPKEIIRGRTDGPIGYARSDWKHLVASHIDSDGCHDAYGGLANSSESLWATTSVQTEDLRPEHAAALLPG